MREMMPVVEAELRRLGYSPRAISLALRELSTGNFDNAVKALRSAGRR
jgi:hypothetical protein